MSFEQVSGYVLFILLIIVVLGSSIGLDFRKWWSWLFVLAGFLLGIVMHFVSGNDPSTRVEGVCLGTFFAFGVLIGGTIMMRRRKGKS